MFSTGPSGIPTGGPTGSSGPNGGKNKAWEGGNAGNGNASPVRKALGTYLRSRQRNNLLRNEAANAVLNNVGGSAAVVAGGNNGTSTSAIPRNPRKSFYSPSKMGQQGAGESGTGAEKATNERALPAEYLF